MKRFALYAVALMTLVAMPTLSSAMATPEPIPIETKFIAPSTIVAGDFILVERIETPDKAFAPIPVYDMKTRSITIGAVPAYRHIDPGRF